MKSFSMNKMLGSIKRKPTAGPDASDDPQGDSPEAIAARSVRAFCESGSAENAGDEVTFLPAIVDAAESSPAAAAECARILRKYLHRDFWSKPSYQYNAIMLTRILADNPGPTFTRNLDKKYIETAKEILRSGRDPSVRQMLMETLDAFEQTKVHDEGVQPLVEMWKKEKDKAYKAYGAPQSRSRNQTPSGGRTLNAPPFDPHSQNYFSRSHSSRRLPDPVELANRLEEARTSAKLLQQVLSCTPPAEVLDHELIREFADRCLSASRSIQAYMAARDPSPDNDTMEALIDTNEQLQQALNQHQRAVLNARKHLGLGERSENVSPAAPPGDGADGRGPPPPVPNREFPDGWGKGKSAELPPLPPGAAAAGPSRSRSGTPREEENPFRDPQPEPSRPGGSSRPAGPVPAEAAEPRLALEPFNPGFTLPADRDKGAHSDAAFLQQRQDSAIRNTTMRGAADGAAAASEGPRPSKEDDDGMYDDGEAYDAPPRNGQPMYRY